MATSGQRTTHLAAAHAHLREPMRRPEATTAAATAAARAREAYAAMQARFAVAGDALYREHALPRFGDRRYAYYWPFAQALAAALAIAALPDDDGGALAQARRLAHSHREHYWDRASRPPGGASYPVTDGGGAKYYDDNLWMGLNLVELHRLTGEAAWLDDARAIFTFVAAGWDDDPAHPAPGGVFWTQDPSNATRDRNTAANAPAAELALHLHDLTGDDTYLAWARRLFAWVELTLRDLADGLYWDHIRLDGTIERTKWSYNQGTMLGAALLLHQQTDEAAFLERARRIAAAALQYYRDDDRLWAQDPAFNAIFFDRCRHLARHNAPSPHKSQEPAVPAELASPPHKGEGPGVGPLLAAYTERAWTAGRDPKRGLYHFGRRGRVPLLNQAAAVRLFATLALMTSDPCAAARRSPERQDG